MTSTKSNKEEMALAQLALQLNSAESNSIVGTAPTDEELTALYENKLSDTRRAQLLSHIANDSSIHERWIRCVETLAYIDEIENKSTAPSAIKEKAKRGFFGFINDLLTPKTLMGGGFSTAAIIVIVISILPPQNNYDIQMSLNGAYNSWGSSLEQEWRTLPTDQKPTPKYSSDRSYFSDPKVKSNIQRVLETGFKISMKQIGDTPFKDYGITQKQLESIKNIDVATVMNNKQYDSLVQTGQIAALASLQCKLDSNSERLKQLTQSLAALRLQLTELQIDEAKILHSVMDTKNSKAVCLTAQYVVDLIRN